MIARTGRWAALAGLAAMAGMAFPACRGTGATGKNHAALDRLVLADHFPWYGYKEPLEGDKATADRPLLGSHRCYRCFKLPQA